MRRGLATQRLGSALRTIPALEAAYARRALQRRDAAGLFSGVYDTWEEALAAAPAGREQGWDNEGAASVWPDGEILDQPSIYPVLFWLRQILAPNSVLLDYGGGVGNTFYPCARRTPVPDGVRWIVAEVPAMAAEGRRLATRRGAGPLEFTTEAVFEAADILLTAGALQYVNEPILALLKRFPAPPRHILFNKLPLTAGEEFCTLQNFGPAVAPYRIFSEQTFLADLEAAGYRLRDRWRVFEVSVEIPFHPEKYLATTHGFYVEHG